MKADLHSYIMHSDTHKGHAENPYKQHEHVKKYEKVRKEELGRN